MFFSQKSAIKSFFIMGCCTSIVAYKSEQEEKEHKPNSKSEQEEKEPLKSSTQTVTVTKYENNNKSSILNNFHTSNDNNNTLTTNRIRDNGIVDSHGNIHINKYYNITRNHNLSVASKTDRFIRNANANCYKFSTKL